MTGDTKPIKIFYSYSHKDKKLRDKLETHLSALQRDGVIQEWHDGCIQAGQEWEKTIYQQFAAAELVLLLISPDFIRSEFCYGIEMKQALRRHEAGQVRVIPIILRPTDWEKSPFSKLQCLPAGGKPVTEWRPQDKAFLNIAKGIRQAVGELHPAPSRSIDWKPYLESVCRDSRYAISPQCYIPLDALDRRSGVQVKPPFLLDLRVRTVQESGKETKQQEKEEKVERLGVLEGLRRYAAEHVLLVGRPGSGKTTALQRLLVEEAEKALREADTRIPVLLELRHYLESTLELIKRALQERGMFMDPQRLQELLQQGHLLLLVDGINELPSEAARELEVFRRSYRATTPMIFTTRELAAGGGLGIDKRLAMEPLTEPQMQQFVRTYLGEDGDKLLRQLQGRLQELAGVPLLLWMLCWLFRKGRERLPENLGLALCWFTSFYERELKDGVPISEKSRDWWRRLLRRLAFMMLQGPGPKHEELYVAISRPQAEDWLAEYLQEEGFARPLDQAMDWLKDLLNHHLLQRSAGDRIEFRHQFIQEYYAAEYLLHNLPKMDDAALQRDYLNYLKWTEPLILMLGLIEDRNQMRRVVKLATEVDWQLAARLAGAVLPAFQQEAISFGSLVICVASY